MPPKEPVKKWKAPKGPKPVHHKNKNLIGLGRAIANVKKNKVEYLPDGELRYTTEKHEDAWVKLRSVTQENSLDEFLNTAELADTDFTAERGASVKIIKIDASKNQYLLTKAEELERSKLHKEFADKLTCPRRPAWDATTTRTQLERQEKVAFLEWRRQLAVLQQNNDLLLTPFERNLEVWRQLWRVVERSDLVVQIVDARNPLLFRSIDLDVYVKEVNPLKKSLLLVNKADLLSDSQRLAWAEYFIAHDIRYTFFSAKTANSILELESLGEEVDVAQIYNDEDVDPRIRILRIEQLEDLFLAEAPEPLTKPRDPSQAPITQIGLVGYPNVGKSSTINALVGSKKVSVSSTPGKTKHFQTIHLSPSVLLCDCPGLVFPNFAYTNGELVCNGVLPIDQLREYTGPCTLVAQRIPKYFLEAIYGIAIPTKRIEEGGTGVPTSQELLTAYARARGYMTAGFGSADESRAARYVLKDYVAGKLLYVQAPPDPTGAPISREDALVFNKDLFSLDKLSESRREQLIAAAKLKGLDIDSLDLSKDLASLNFSAHIGGSASDNSRGAAQTGSNYGGKQAALYSAGDALDKEFFLSDNVKGTFATPFHKLQNAAGNGKKHGKKNSKGNRMKVTDDF
ncbi:hypothetical protein BABINDRAFT_40286 [Babjeviella inositovora NRRL Y-12698]|uniref:CP-type G domain-containing protein n=1 Tax=Babjeviella inositovora NRRL Y-12698 TaxID=984486 RepID=A0A1E3QKQ2_9ASCO|nr:uncharacterized protein BABINDRAFT_40286 [Babjeviella inositovora NRRL Y-12698]ODQ78034.1 hypothetical protein BABINDRAFT_40286 [Babjeviella inositovora NRRL Y-12698]